MTYTHMGNTLTCKIKQILKKKRGGWVAHAYSPSTRENEAEGLYGQYGWERKSKRREG